MIDKDNFLREVKNEIELLTEATKEQTKSYNKIFFATRNKRLKEEREETKQELLLKIKDLNFFQPRFGLLINAFIDNNIREHDLRFVTSSIESKVQNLVPINTYLKIGQEARNELYSELEKHIKQTETPIPVDYLQNIEIFRDHKMDDNEVEDFVHHFKKITLSYLKGYILQNNIKYYTIEVIDSVLWLIEKSKPETLQLFYLFEYPRGLVKVESEDECLSIVKSWYEERGRKITSFEDLLNTEIEKGEYKDARRIFHRYGYLFSENFKREKEQVLLHMLYDKYTEYQKTEDEIKRKHQMNEILNELLCFQPEATSSK